MTPALTEALQKIAESAPYAVVFLIGLATMWKYLTKVLDERNTTSDKMLDVITKNTDVMAKLSGTISESNAKLGASVDANTKSTDRLVTNLDSVLRGNLKNP